MGEERSDEEGREEERDRDLRRERGQAQEEDFFFLLSITFFILNLLICKMPHLKKNSMYLNKGPSE